MRSSTPPISVFSFRPTTLAQSIHSSIRSQEHTHTHAHIHTYIGCALRFFPYLPSATLLFLIRSKEEVSERAENQQQKRSADTDDHYQLCERSAELSGKGAPLFYYYFTVIVDLRDALTTC